MTIKLTIDRFEGGQAILKTEDGVAISWPKDKLPKDVHEGAVLVFYVTNEKEAEKEKRALAKDILNEILNTEKDE